MPGRKKVAKAKRPYKTHYSRTDFFEKLYAEREAFDASVNAGVKKADDMAARRVNELKFEMQQELQHLRARMGERGKRGLGFRAAHRLLDLMEENEE